jgi:hypothetical protein
MTADRDEFKYVPVKGRHSHIILFLSLISIFYLHLPKGCEAYQLLQEKLVRNKGMTTPC